MNEADIQALAWDKQQGLLPAIVQDATTHRVLMLGYMDRAALQATLATGRVTFFSRSKQRLWMKGESSGDILELVSLEADCDADTLLMLVDPAGPSCHTGRDNCFFEALTAEGALSERAEPSLPHLFELALRHIDKAEGHENAERVWIPLVAISLQPFLQQAHDSIGLSRSLHAEA